MAASVQFRPQTRELGMVVREVDEDLAIFLGMKNAEKEKNGPVHALDEDSVVFDESTEPKPDGLLISNASQSVILQISADENFLNREIDSSDYDWLLAQPATSLLPTVEVEGQDSATSQSEISSGDCTSLKSELTNTCDESASPNKNSVQTATSRSLQSGANKRSLSSGPRKPTSRAATPTRRPALPSKSKPSRASTPTSRATLPSSKSTAAQPSSRSSAPASSPSMPTSSNIAPRAAILTRKPATSSTISGTSAPYLSSAGRKTGLKNPVTSCGISQTVKSRPSKPSYTLPVTHDGTQNPKTCMPRRPASASRGRPSVSATNSNGKPRQKSCSPARVRNPNSATAHKAGSIMLSKSRGYGNGDDDVNPALIGTKMVERVVNMRKLAPPKQDEYISRDNSRKSSQENSGFGRSLSKKSLDMAIRHMDIRRSINEN